MEANCYKNKLIMDLHCHLDGSFTPEFIKGATGDSRELNVLNEAISAPNNCSSLTEYLTCFDLPIKALQTQKNITAGVLDVLKKASLDGVKYIELRFAPNCSTQEGLSLPEIYESAIEGSKQGLKEYNVHSNIILCAMRHHTMDTNMKILDTMYDYIGHGICALDLAGDESIFPNQNFYDLFKKAKDMQIPFTIHSGECGSVENVKLAMEFGAKRIGHGIALINNTSLMQEIKKKQIGLELCPVSNFQTRAWENFDSYPLRSFLDNGLLATINTDNRTVSKTSLARELSEVCTKMNICQDDILVLNKNSIDISFADDNIKHQLSKYL